MKPVTRLLTILAAAVALALIPHAAQAAEPLVLDSELSEYLAPFFEEHGLNEDNFAMGYCYTATGESWFYNGDKWMTGGSVYKLPLNMVYCDYLADGTFSPDDLVAGVSIDRAQYFSIVESNNDISEAMQKHLVGNRADYYVPYRREIAKYCGVDPDDLPDKYYENGNFFSPKFMINTLKYLYDNSNDYETLIGYLKEAHPGKYFKKYVDEYEIAHKYGYLDGEVNDAAIVYTPQPFLLSAFTYHAGDGESLLGELCELMTQYTLQLDEKYAEALTVTDTPVAAASTSTPSPEQIDEHADEAEVFGKTIDVEKTFVLVACGIIAFFLIASAIWDRRHKKK